MTKPILALFNLAKAISEVVSG